MSRMAEGMWDAVGAEGGEREKWDKPGTRAHKTASPHPLTPTQQTTIANKRVTHKTGDGTPFVLHGNSPAGTEAASEGGCSLPQMMWGLRHRATPRWTRLCAGGLPKQPEGLNGPG